MRKRVVLAIAGCMLWGAAFGAEPERPNILFVYTDDQAPWAVGVAGNPLVKTPHMDGLFRSGAYLVNSFTTTPVCSPSRASLMTSRYGTELGITDWIRPYKKNKKSRNQKEEPGEMAWGLDPAQTVWPRLLQKAGYETALIGKWHLGELDRYHPSKMGFAHFMGHRRGGWSTADPTLEKEGKETAMAGLTADILADEVVTFLKRERTKPFLCCWHTRAPHTRWLPVSEEDEAPYAKLPDEETWIPHSDYPGLDTKRVKRYMREYLSSVRSVDRNLGRVLATLDELGIAEKTIVIFTSDHGYAVGHNGIWHKGNGHWILKQSPAMTNPNIPKGQRPNMYDTSLRVPTAVRWPGVVKAGTVIEETVQNIDWFPTILAMAGVDMPEEAVVRGRDVTPLLRGEKVAWDNAYYGEYSTLHQSRTHMRCWRTPEYKLMRDFLNGGRDEFYDLRKDPGETTNLINTRDEHLQKVITEYDAAIRAKMTGIGDAVGGSGK